MKRKYRQVTEKKKPHYNLAELKKLIENEKTRHIQPECIKNANRLGISYWGIIEIVRSVSSDDFYKSMTEYENYKIWQDVYRHRHDDLILYIKLKKSADSKGVVIQLKEK